MRRQVLKKHTLSAVLIAAALAAATPALALDITPYGAIRVGSWYTASTYYAYPATATATSPARGTAQHDGDFTFDLQGDSFVGMRVKEADFSAVAEIGAYNPKNRSAGLELRLLFGEWDFGGGKVRVGYAPSPYVYRSEQAFDSDGGFNGYGSLWDGRMAQIKVSANNGLYLTLMKQGTGSGAGGGNDLIVVPGSTTAAANGNNWNGTAFTNTATQYAAANTNYDTFMPKTIVGYEGKSGILTYGGGAAANFFKVTPSAADAVAYQDEIYSYLGFAHCKIDLAPVEIKLNAYTGQNVGNLMSNPGAANGSLYFRNAAGQTANAYTYGGWAQLGYIMNEKVKMFAGASYETNDTRLTSADERMAAFANLQYAVTRNIKVVPEFSFLNDMTNRLGQKEPRVYASGVKWEMTF
jgi:hypothetical protein